MALTENHNLVKAKLDQLNRTSGTGWKAVQGFNAPPMVILSEGNKMSMITDAGFPVKIFVNTETGEIRLFAAANFI